MKNNPQKKCEHIWNRVVSAAFKDKICALCGVIEPIFSPTESTAPLKPHDYSPLKPNDYSPIPSPTQPDPVPCKLEPKEFTRNVSNTCITDKKLDTESWEEEWDSQWTRPIVSENGSWEGKRDFMSEAQKSFIHQVLQEQENRIRLEYANRK